MTILPNLERDLIDAAARTAATASASRPPARRSRPRLGAFVAIGLSSTVAIAVAAVLLVAGHGAPRSNRPATRPGAPSSQAPATHPGAPPSASRAGRRRLLSTLGVLRRPQTPADLRNGFLQSLLRPTPNHRASRQSSGVPDIKLIRRATTAPWGAGIFLVPLRPVSAALRAPGAGAGVSRGIPLPASLAQWHLEIVSQGGGACCIALSQIPGGRAGFIGGRSGPHQAPITRITYVVPDGVARVTIDFNTRPPVTVAVHGNVAAAQVQGQCCDGPGSLDVARVIWRAADGRVIKVTP